MDHPTKTYVDRLAGFLTFTTLVLLLAIGVCGVAILHQLEHVNSRLDRIEANQP